MKENEGITIFRRKVVQKNVLSGRPKRGLLCKIIFTLLSRNKKKEEVICWIHPANSDLFAGLIRQIVAYLPDIIRQIVSYLPD